MSFSQIGELKDFVPPSGWTANQRYHLAGLESITPHILSDFPISDDSIQMLDPVGSKHPFPYARA
jgi:hypothetical protein